MITDLLLTRHGEAYNTAPLDGLRDISDPANPPLTPLGERQADELRVVLADFAPTTIITSPFLRAVQTAWPFVSDAANAAVPVMTAHRFGEQLADPVFAHFRGLNLVDYEQRFNRRIGFDPELENRETFPAYPEQPDSVRARVASLWHALDSSPDVSSRLVFVGHGATLGALLTLLVPSYTGDAGHVNCGVTRLQRTSGASGTWRVLHVNRKDHLSKFGASASLS